MLNRFKNNPVVGEQFKGAKDIKEETILIDVETGHLYKVIQSNFIGELYIADLFLLENGEMKYKPLRDFTNLHLYLG